MSRPLLSAAAAPAAWAPVRLAPPRWLRQLLLLLCAAAAIAVFVLTLLLPGMLSPPQTRHADRPAPALARCEAHQAVFLC